MGCGAARGIAVNEQPDSLPSPSEPTADSLFYNMRATYEALLEAYSSYQASLRIAADAEFSSDGLFILRQSGREYASAVKRYSEAVMAWLVMIETKRDKAAELLRGIVKPAEDN